MPKSQDNFLSVTLASQTLGDVRLIDMQRSAGGTTLWFGQGDLAEVTVEGQNSVDVVAVPGGAKCTVSPLQSVTVNGDLASIDPDRTAVNHGFLSGRRVVMGLRYVETAQDVVFWLSHHEKHHGADAAVVVDLGPENEAQAFRAALRNQLANSALRLAVVRSPIPLGHPTLPPSDHPFNAPAAPGKARMTDLRPDQRTSPLSESLVFEVLRRRLLMQAKSVLSIDICDLMLPGEKKSSVFERVEAAEGYLAVSGQEAYPWRTPKKRQVCHADHIYRQFDRSAQRTRWAAVPSRDESSIWRFVRIAGATCQKDHARFVRCMGLRHPTHPVSAIVPKTALVEDTELLRFSKDTLDHSPERAPKPASPNKGTNPGTVTVVTCMKNEGPFILEWLAHHRSIGIERFLVYSNDCDDGTDDMLDLLQQKGLIQHRQNPFKTTGQKPQHAAFQAAETEELVTSTDWLVAMDVDEYINIHVGEGRLTDLFAAAPDANMISMTWRLFGNADVDNFKDEPITRQFTRCAPEIARKPHQAWGFKTLFRRRGTFRKIGVHRPKGLVPQRKDEIVWVNGSGRPMPETAYRNAWRSTMSTYGYDLVTLNHYAVRSTESFLVKRDRGRVNHVDRDQGLLYWFRMNNNTEEDTSILKQEDQFQIEYQKLMSDREIRAAHETSVEHHRAKIKTLLLEPENRAFYDQLSSARMQKLSRMHSHFGSGVFWSGPQVIPDDIVQKDPSEPFFFTVDPVGKGH